MGGRDDALLADVLTDMADDLEELDNTLETADLDLWAGPTAGEAVAEIIAGQPCHGIDASEMYSGGFEAVCSYLGPLQRNDYFSPCRVEWFETLDTLLEQFPGS